MAIDATFDPLPYVPLRFSGLATGSPTAPAASPARAGAPHGVRRVAPAFSDVLAASESVGPAAGASPTHGSKESLTARSEVDGALRRTVYDGVGATPAEKEASLRWAARQLESFLINQLFKAMRDTVSEGGLFEKSRAQKIYRQMLDREMARSLSVNSPLGLADQIVQQLEDEI